MHVCLNTKDHKVKRKVTQRVIFKNKSEKVEQVGEHSKLQTNR